MNLKKKARKGLLNPRLAVSHILRSASNRIQNPELTFMELTELYHSRFLGKNGQNVMDADWDNLIILDSCRYDLFEEANTLSGDLSAVTSIAGWTNDFLWRTFGDLEFPDIVYVSANPMLVHCDARFHERVRLWETDWSEEYDVVLPEPVAKAALETEERYPDKRLVVHFMQPHYPFVGEFGQQLLADERLKHYENGIEFWRQVETGPVTRDEFWQAYRENLDITLPHVSNLLEGLTGKSVVTSDHGNVFDYHGIYGHMRGFTDGLRTVPWLVVDDGHRKDVVQGTATAGPRDIVTREDESVAKERLRQLGYAE